MATRNPSLVPEVGTELCRVKLEGGSLGGYRCEILTGNISERELKTYKCPRCKGIMKDGVISNNGKQICRYCLAGVEEPLLDSPIRSSIQSLKCKCPLSKRGCDWLGTLETVEDHMKKCGYVYVSCELMCGVVTTHSQVRSDLRERSPRRKSCLHCSEVHKVCEMEGHVKVCGKVEIMCELGCGTRVCRDGMLCHRQNECPEETVVCPYWKYGCEFEGIKKRELQQHLEMNRSLHLELKLNILEEKNLSLTRDNEMLLAKIGVNEKKIQALETRLESNEFLKETILVREIKTVKWSINNILNYYRPNRGYYMNPSSDKFVAAGYNFRLHCGTDTTNFIIYFQIMAPYDRLEWPLRAIFITRVISPMGLQNSLKMKSETMEIQKGDIIYKRICAFPLSTDLCNFIRSRCLNLEVTLRILEI